MAKRTQNPDDATTPTQRRRPLSGLDSEDVKTLGELVSDAIKTGRKDESVTDVQLSRLYALSGKLSKIAEAKRIGE